MSELRQFLEEYRVPLAPSDHHHISRARGFDVGTDCPYCSPNSGSFRLGWSSNQRRAHCWICGRINGAAALKLLTNCSWKVAKDLWGSLDVGLPIKKVEKTGKLLLPDAGPLLQAHRDYLEGRGFDPDEIARLWGVGGIGTAPSLSWRILIPIHDADGKVVSWTTRNISKYGKRYINASEEQEEFSAKALLYGMHHAGHSIIICEGPLDAWAFGPGAVATMGLVYTETQLSLMAGFPVRTICFDAERPAQRRAMRLLAALSEHPGTTRNVLLESGKDAAEASKSEILDIRRKYL